MSYTDTQVLNEIQYQTLETPNSGASMQTDLWTISEIVAYMTQRVRRFVAETSLALTVGSTATTIGQNNYDLLVLFDSLLVDIRRAAWLDSASFSYELQRADKRQWDALAPEWVFSPDVPTAYSTATEPSATIDLVPAPLAAGTLELAYTKQSIAFLGTGVGFAIADEFVAFVKYGTLADMLKKDGPAQDIPRSEYCEGRFEEGIMLANLLTDGVAAYGQVAT